MSFLCVSAFLFGIPWLVYSLRSFNTYHGEDNMRVYEGLLKKVCYLIKCMRFFIIFAVGIGLFAKKQYISNPKSQSTISNLKFQISNLSNVHQTTFYIS